MLSMKRSWATALILIVTFSAFVLGFTLSYTSLPQPEAEEDYERAAIEVMDKLSKLRGLSLPERFEVKVVSSSWVREHWGKPLTVEEPLEWKIYKALLFIPTEASFEEFEEEWAGYIMAASSGETLYIVRDMVEGVEERVLKRTLAHESIHILQYVNFEIVRPGIYDAEQALNALIEGDADLSADLFLEAEGLKPPEKKAPTLRRGDYREALTLIKLFPYHYGKPFTAYLYEHGGWKLLNKAYEKPPSSTEQVMHPEKYLQGEGFEKPELPAPEEDWRLLGENRLGEYFIYVFLARWIGYEIAEVASEGWNGDRAAYYEADGDFLLIWATHWDSRGDAEEFHQAITMMLTNAGGVEIPENLWKVKDIFIALRASDGRIKVFSSNNLEALKQVTSQLET